MKTELIAPLTIFCLTVALLTIARLYDRLPVQLPECGFRKITGIPCVSCRGTRSFKSLSNGDIIKAFTYNPLAVSSCGIAIGWLFAAVAKQSRETKPTRKTRITIVTLLLLAANWLYLILTDHWF